MEHPINSNNPFADNEMPLPHTPYPRLHGFIHTPPPQPRTKTSRATRKRPPMSSVPISISGLVVEYIVTIDVTRVRFPADAICPTLHLCTRTFGKKQNLDRRTNNSKPKHCALPKLSAAGLPRDGRKYLPLYYHGSA